MDENNVEKRRFEYGFLNIKGENIDERRAELEDYDEETVELLKEIYPVIGRMALDTSNNREKLEIRNSFENCQNGRWASYIFGRFFGRRDELVNQNYNRLNALTRISEYNDTIIELRSMLYREISRDGLARFEVSGECKHIIKSIACRLIDNLDNLYFERGFLMSEIEEALFSSEISEHERGLFGFLEKTWSEYIRDDAIEGLKKAFSSMEAIRNSQIGNQTNTIWIHFLLRLFWLALIDEEYPSYREDGITYRLENTPTDMIEGYNTIMYARIDGLLCNLQVKNSKDMLYLYQYNTLSSRAFFSHDVIRKVYEIISSCTDLCVPYIGGAGTDSGKRCFAAMINKDTSQKYAALSGVLNASMYLDFSNASKKEIAKAQSREIVYQTKVNLLKLLLGPEYIVIDNDDDVMYYVKNKKISSQSYRHSVKPYDKRPGKRMYSCCERKLSTQFRLGCEHVMYVKYEPCEMCKRMLDAETRGNQIFANVLSWQSYNKKLKMSVFDKSANEVI